MILNRSSLLTMGLGLTVVVSVFSAYAPLYTLAITLLAACVVSFFLWTEKVSLFFSHALIWSIFLLPNKSMMGFNFRFEDVLTIPIIIFVAILLFSKKQKIGLHAVSQSITFYLGYCLLISLAAVLIANINPLYFMYFVKEVQYFVYFLFILLVNTRFDATKGLIRSINYMSILTVCWGLYQVLTGNALGYYGIGIISVTSSVQSGMIFFMMFVFYLYQLMAAKTKRHNIFYLTALGMSAVMTIATISRTSIFAVIVLSCLVIGKKVFFSRSKPLKVLSVVTVPLLLLVGDNIANKLMGGELLYKISDRISRIDQGSSDRFSKWQWMLERLDLAGILFGKGKGYAQEITGGFVLAADNQFLRLLIEVGVIGLILWLFIILSLFMFGFKNRSASRPESNFIILLLIGFMSVSITHEAFVVTLQASLFWIMMGIMISAKLKRLKIHSA